MKKIKNFSNYYIDIEGNIYNKKTNKIINQSVDKYGYLRVMIYDDNNIQRSRFVHRLLAECYINNKLNKKQVNHINGIKTDNRIENLEWATAKENSNHALKIGLKQNTINSLIERTSKIVLNKENGVFYNNIKEASIYNNLKYYVLVNMLNNKIKNSTNLILA